MRVTNKAIFGIFLLILFINAPTKVEAALTWIVSDEKYDVERLFEGVSYGTGHYHEEIDIKAIKLEENGLILTFLAAPKNDRYHLYTVEVCWSVNLYRNITYGIFGDSENRIYTRLLNEQGIEISNTETIGGIITNLNTIIMPVPDLYLIQNSSKPRSVQVLAQATDNLGYNYLDALESAEFSYEIGLDNVTSVIAFFGSFTIISLLTVKKKKRVY